MSTTDRPEFERTPNINSVLKNGPNWINIKEFTSRLSPINCAPEGKTVFDNISFVIFCPKHQRISVCDTIHRRDDVLSGGNIAVWLPFLYLSPTLSKDPYIPYIEGISLILSDGDSELMAKYKEVVPFDFELFDVKVVMIGTTDIRHELCLARLHTDNNVVQCCHKTSRIHWLSVDEINTNLKDCFWGSEVQNYCNIVKDIEPLPDRCRLIKPRYHSFGLLDPYLGEEDIIDAIPQRVVENVFNDFYEHCFPSFEMSFLSFKDYLTKSRWRRTNREMSRLFNAFDIRQADSLLFEEMAVGLAMFEPKCPNTPSRIAMIFRYYDDDRDGYLSEVELRQMVSDLYGKDFLFMINKGVEEGLIAMKATSKGISFDTFVKSVAQFRDTSVLCRSQISLLRRFDRLRSSAQANNAVPKKKWFHSFKEFSFKHKK